MTKLRSVGQLDAHKRLFISLGFAGLTALVLPRSLDSATQIVAVWLAFTVASLGLSWIIIATAHPRNLRSLSEAQDMSRTLSFLFIILAAFASLIAIIILFQSGANGQESNKSLHVTLSALVVVCSWMSVHTVFTLHYARLYYEQRGVIDQTTHEPKSAGLDFPDDDEPDYLDFAYFSFIIGMTSQVSDVAIRSKSLRRLALLHGILSFFFNTTIIALSINTVSNVLQR